MGEFWTATVLFVGRRILCFNFHLNNISVILRISLHFENVWFYYVYNLYISKVMILLHEYTVIQD